MENNHFDNYRGDYPGDVHHHQYNHHNQHDYNQQQHDYHHRNQHNHHDYHHRNHHDHNHFGGGGFGPSSGGFGPSSGAYGHSSSHSGQKRAFHHSGPDSVDSVKLYVASIPNTVTEEDIRPLFEEYGNVVEIVLLKDKRTGQQQGACFVKYANLEEADRAIKVLHNLQAFPGASDRLVVRYADGERQRIGIMGERLYIGGLNKRASMPEIEDIFSPYGVVEDIYLVCDEMKQYRGYGFLKFSHRDMAWAAINALNGVYFMRGCDQPLIVRFAEPKKPKNGDSRVNSAFIAPTVGSQSQETFARVISNIDDHLVGLALPNASMSNSSTGSALPEAVFHPPHLSPPLLRQASSQLGPPSFQQCPPNDRYPQAIATASGDPTAVLPSNMANITAVPETAGTVASLDCDWSEHTCPDGFKYYFNCTTYESRWEKPDEYNSFEQLVMKQLSTLSCQQGNKQVNKQSSTTAVTTCV